MADYTGHAVAPAFWKIEALPGYPAVLTRIFPDGPFEVARYDVPSKAQITPAIEAIGKGLFRVTTHYENSLGDVREMNRYVLISGPYSILALTDGLGAAIEGALK